MTASGLTATRKASVQRGRTSTPPPSLPLTPTLSPSAGARGKPTYCRRSSLSPAEGERVGVRGPAVVLTRCARSTGSGLPGKQDSPGWLHSNGWPRRHPIPLWCAFRSVRSPETLGDGNQIVRLNLEHLVTLVLGHRPAIDFDDLLLPILRTLNNDFPGLAGAGVPAGQRDGLQQVRAAHWQERGKRPGCAPDRAQSPWTCYTPG